MVVTLKRNENDEDEMKYLMRKEIERSNSES